MFVINEHHENMLREKVERYKLLTDNIAVADLNDIRELERSISRMVLVLIDMADNNGGCTHK